MATQIAKCLVSVLIAALFLTLASSDAPFIVAHKKATLTRLKSGVERVSASIDIYNQGSATAYDVSLTDDSWSKDVFHIISGNTSMSWERLDVGALVSHDFELESEVQALFYGAPAVITFRIPTKAALQEAYSTPILPLDILADRPPVKKFEWAKTLLAKYGSLISVISIMASFVYLVATPSKSNAAKGSKKKR
ncbi:hypothetical protein CsSME_00004738 [Camellia sinensis var. sinensis]|uniref:translocon-associated protein subunit beta-like n=1 Tax=Camellia sinensis TaxID=4442 RepID=UPI0010369007|nr:translocon-associated protein subunit beta-like [Camellia sinensis]